MKPLSSKEILIDVHTHIGTDLLFYLQKHYPYAQDWISLVKEGERHGISRFVVFPMVSHIGLDWNGLCEGKIITGKEAIVPYAFENRRMMVEIQERFPDHAKKALPLWMVDPSRNPEGQVQAIRDLNQQYPCVGLKVQATVIQSYIRDFLGKGGVLLDLAEEKGWPVLIHTSVHPEDPWSCVKDILTVTKSRPRIRFNLAHSCRFDLAALDQIAELPNAWFDCSAHRIHCQLAVENHLAVAQGKSRFPSDYRDPFQVLSDLAERYPTKLMWGSDAPFDSYIDDQMGLKSSYQEEVEVLHRLEAAVKHRIGYTNTMNFLGLPL